jgi:glutamyl-tRNA synthetase
MFDDLVYGKTGQNRSNNKLDLIERVYDDPILLKSDGHPTYHLANVVDDHCMKITHVIRGTEWMPSTPMHVALYNAFNWTPPRFGHVPLLVDKSGQKLSKRNADIDLSYFKDKHGVFAATLVNFAALLGWSHTQKSDVFSLEELEQLVS